LVILFNPDNLELQLTRIIEVLLYYYNYCSIFLLNITG